ncbi:nucleoside hydrolase [Umezawaea sp. Da 62-37]|uniref:nucleoside hydrolase n=1 Tax=Umezawaea sp. Da 62-37 TaxID=3075927 RepID=UPI0037DD2FEE
MRCDYSTSAGSTLYLSLWCRRVADRWAADDRRVRSWCCGWPRGAVRSRLLSSTRREGTAEQLVRLARDRRGEISLFALGPLTNLAHALTIEPELPMLLHEVVWMAGRDRVPGNITSQVDTDTWHDPEAAHAVLGAGFRMTMVLMDATNHAWAGEQWFGRLARHGSRQATYAHDVVGHYLDFYSRFDVTRRGERGCLMQDPMAAVLLVEAEMATFENHAVSVELAGTYTRGMTVVDLRGYDTTMDPTSSRPPIRVATKVDHVGTKTLVIDSFTSRSGDINTTDQISA